MPAAEDEQRAGRPPAAAAVDALHVRKPSALPGMPPGAKPRDTRTGSVVYPEAEDQGKPKFFARQSFIVSGEDEELADAILEARKRAMERRRSVADDGTAGAGRHSRQHTAESYHENTSPVTIVTPAAVAMRLPPTVVERPPVEELAESEPEEPPKSPTAEDAAAAAAAADAEVDAAAAAAAAGRRRSSVLQRIPEKLRALIQQSDENGVQLPQQQMDHAAVAAAAVTAAAAAQKQQYQPAGQEPAADTHEKDVASSNGAMPRPQQPASWCSALFSCMKTGGATGVAGGHADSQGNSDGEDDDDPYGKEAPDTPATVAGESPPLLPPQAGIDIGRKLLVLDLDETLVHSSFKPVPNADYVLDIQVDSTPYKVFVLKRPGVDEFLTRVAKLYEVIIFTASLPQYANPLLDILDPKRTIRHRLFREHCTFHEGYFVKDLTLLRGCQDLRDTIIVDNSPMAYMFQPENAIDCTSWLEDRSDRELYVIADFLEATHREADVRDNVEWWREGAAVLQNAEVHLTGE